MAELKTKPQDADVERYLADLPDPKRDDCLALAQLMTEVTGEPARMWGTSIVGFGTYHYVYGSGREGDWFLCGFAPRARNLTLYIMSGFAAYDDLMARLGKHTTGKSCLYIKGLADVDRAVLRDLLEQSVRHMRAISA